MYTTHVCSRFPQTIISEKYHLNSDGKCIKSPKLCCLTRDWATSAQWRCCWRAASGWCCPTWRTPGRHCCARCRRWIPSRGSLQQHDSARLHVGVCARTGQYTSMRLSVYTNIVGTTNLYSEQTYRWCTCTSTQESCHVKCLTGTVADLFISAVPAVATAIANQLEINTPSIVTVKLPVVARL